MVKILKKKTVFLSVVGTLVVLMLVLSACTKESVPPNVVLAVKTNTAPTLDGQAETIWDKVNAAKITVAGGVNNGNTEILVKSVYTGDSVYFLAQWADPTQSYQRAPFQKQADGAWIALTDPNDKGGDNNLYYEDKLALIWNINNSIAGFNQQGCMVTCHVGETKPFGNKYTANAGEIGDIWHWKSVRNGPVAQIDDQYLDNTRYDKQASPEAGRKSDPKTGGGYTNNVLENGLPKFALPNNKKSPPYWILDSEKVAFDNSKYIAKDEVPGIIVAPFVGDRADINGKGVWKDGKWTLEWGRKLNTGSQYDVQYTDLTKSYFFGIAAFDNAQVRHAWSNGAYELRFAK